ncbi:MAG: hypothetical protein EA408_11595 [Marinilabiliales bacterium]|nr:MAG: hypothetical protein EA408_11595 [Marinilabiliales bacterium]
MHKQFICYNGEMVPSEKPAILHTNRAFCYGDSLFETIHANGTRLQFFESHYRRLTEGMRLIGMEPESLPGEENLETVLERLLNKNHLYTGVRIRLSVFRNSGGFYKPSDNSVSYIAETVPLANDRYALNDKGLKTGMFNGIKKQPDKLANLKTANSLLYISAAIYARSEGLDDCFIQNTDGNIAEATSSNIFIVKGDTISTPSLEEGCVAGIMREQIIRLVRWQGMTCIETAIDENDLISADECFLTNAVSGIRWVVAYSGKRYYSKTARFLTRLLNQEQFGQ